MRRRLQLVADLSQQLLAREYVGVVLDALGAAAIDHAEYAAALVGLGENHLGRVGGGAEDSADLADALDRVEHAEWVIAVAEEQDETVPGADGPGVVPGQLDQRRIGAAPAHQAGPRVLAEGQAELDPGTQLTRVSWISSTVLMKWLWPRMRLLSSGLSMGTLSSCMGAFSWAV